MAHSPSAGPIASQGSRALRLMVCASETNSRMLAMEMPKPMLFVSVSTLPTACGGALRAVRVENCGESPETVMPHSSSQP